MDRSRVYRMIDGERDRQDVRWSRPRPLWDVNCKAREVISTDKAAVLCSVSGEAAKCSAAMDDLGLRDDLIRVAAVCVAWLEGME